MNTIQPVRFDKHADQLKLFEHVSSTFAQSPESQLSTQELYHQVARRAGLDAGDMAIKVQIGQSGQEHNLIKRQVRWHQQTLKTMGLIERVEGRRGIWQLTQEGKSKLTKIKDNVHMVAYSTELGLAIWGNWHTASKNFNQQIMLCLTSPPYPLHKPRHYGNPTVEEYTDFICKTLEPVVKNLHPAGSIALNVSNDIFEKGSPARSLYKEKMLIALHERLSLSLIDTWVWDNPTKPPGPTQWASKTRQQLNVAWEPVYILSPDPLMFKGNNRRILEPHSEKHLKFVKNGGEKRTASNGDGAYTIKPGSYSNPTEGRIPRNVQTISHVSAENRAFNRDLVAAGLPKHGAMMPAALALKLIKFLTDIEDVVLDVFFGSGTTGKQAEISGRRWIGFENALEYIQGSALRFKDVPSLELNKQIFS